jgi:hypothetical protein
MQSCPRSVSIVLSIVAFIFSCEVQAQMISTIAGNGTGGFSGDGSPATVAELDNPTSVILDKSGNLYIGEIYNFRIRKVDSKGVITTIAGSGCVAPACYVGGFSGDGGPATIAEIGGVTGMAIDTAGNIFFADGPNNRIRKVSTAGIITTVAGSGCTYPCAGGFSGDGGPATAALLNHPDAICMDSAGNLYISDEYNYRIRKVNTSGIISTIAGTGYHGYGGDGAPAITAGFSILLGGIAADLHGNIFISDSNCVRVVNAAGIISRFAGTYTAGYSGDGGPATAAQLWRPGGLDADRTGNVYIADQNSDRIRKVNRAGIISTVAGNGTGGYSGDGMPATAAELAGPADVALDCGGNIFIADYVNQRIRKVDGNHAPAFVKGHTHSIATCGNGLAQFIDSLLTARDIDTMQVLTWGLAAGPAHGTVSGTYATNTTGDTLTPTGLSYSSAPGYSGIDSFRIAVTDCGQLSDTATFYVTINPLPATGVITGTDSVCKNGAAVVLSDAVAGGVWSATNSSAAVAGGVVTGLSAGRDTIVYTVTGTYCVASAMFPVDVVVCPNGVKPLTPKGDPTIWPNPVKDELTVSNAAGSEVRIYDIVGQLSFGGLMMTGDKLMMTSDKQVVNIKGLAPGTYIVRITGDGRMQNFRVVKE